MKKVVFCDIDGTLATRGEIVSQNIDMVNKYERLGGEFVLVSGRSVAYTRYIANKFERVSYVISNNGSIIYDLINNKVLYSNGIDYSSIKKVYDLCKARNTKLVITGIDYDYASIDPNSSNIQKLFSKLDKKLCEDNYTTQLIVTSDIKDNILALEDEINKLEDVAVINKSRSLYDDSYVENSYWLNITIPGINKGCGVKNFCDILEIKLSDTVRIGNDLNDLPMFLDEGVNIAIEDAYDELKVKADFITSKCDAGGVALAINKIINEEI